MLAFRVRPAPECPDSFHFLHSSDRTKRLVINYLNAFENIVSAHVSRRNKHRRPAIFPVSNRSPGHRPKVLHRSQSNTEFQLMQLMARTFKEL